MNRHSGPVFEQAGLEAPFQKRKIHFTNGGTDKLFIGNGSSKRKCDNEGQLAILINIGPWAPEDLVVRFVPGFPNNVAASKVFGRSHRPTGKGLPRSFGSWWTAIVIESIAVVENEQGADSKRSKRRHQ